MRNPNIPHVLVIPFPAQGHVNPLMNFSNKLCENGFKVTFVNSDFTHKRVVASALISNHADEKGLTSPVGSSLKLVSIPDGLGPEDDRNDLASLFYAISSTMPAQLEKLIDTINGEDDRITCVLSDATMAWAMEVAHKLGIKGSVLCPSSAAMFALELHMPKLIEDGIMDSDGFPIIKGEIELSPEMPKVNTTDIPWCCVGDTSAQKIIYEYISKMVISTVHLAEWWLCNTTIELEPGPLSLYPKILPIGPLMENPESARSLGQFWEEDLSCLNWLDQQPHCSVIYVAFGSFTVFDQTQFREIALGLELTNRPFLWVVREDDDDDDDDGRGRRIYPDEFEGKKGKIVKWAPQQKVLSHPAIACFISHCGWNSTMEGVCNGVPFLCWPYFADQFYDKSYVCDAWKVGLGFEEDDNGRIVRGEIKKKVEMLLGDQSIRARSVKLKEMMMNNLAQGGRSSENYIKFAEWLKE